jgi:hypothetical protein
MKKLSIHDLDKGKVVSSILTSIAENPLKQRIDRNGQERRHKKGN